jgi:hypothetical protein
MVLASDMTASNSKIISIDWGGGTDTDPLTADSTGVTVTRIRETTDIPVGEYIVPFPSERVISGRPAPGLVFTVVSRSGLGTAMQDDAVRYNALDGVFARQTANKILPRGIATCSSLSYSTYTKIDPFTGKEREDMTNGVDLLNGKDIGVEECFDDVLMGMTSIIEGGAGLGNLRWTPLHATVANNMMYSHASLFDTEPKETVLEYASRQSSGSAQQTCRHTSKIFSFLRPNIQTDGASVSRISNLDSDENLYLSPVIGVAGEATMTLNRPEQLSDFMFEPVVTTIDDQPATLSPKLRVVCIPYYISGPDFDEQVDEYQVLTNKHMVQCPALFGMGTSADPSMVYRDMTASDEYWANLPGHDIDFRADVYGSDYSVETSNADAITVSIPFAMSTSENNGPGIPGDIFADKFSRPGLNVDSRTPLHGVFTGDEAIPDSREARSLITHNYMSPCVNGIGFITMVTYRTECVSGGAVIEADLGYLNTFLKNDQTQKLFSALDAWSLKNVTYSMSLTTGTPLITNSAVGIYTNHEMSATAPMTSTINVDSTSLAGYLRDVKLRRMEGVQPLEDSIEPIVQSFPIKEPDGSLEPIDQTKVYMTRVERPVSPDQGGGPRHNTTSGKDIRWV